jgi:ribose-phosphate pyrophosphokinase
MIKINNQNYEIKKFPDGTLNMTNCRFPTQADIRPITIIWTFEHIEEQIVLYNLVKHLKNISGTSRIILILPYVPNARMDRVKDPYSEVPTLKYFCEFINNLYFYRVIVCDVHSPVTMTLLDRAIDVGCIDYVESVIEEINPDFIFFPDHGAYDRYKDEINMRTPFFGEKLRDWSTGHITGLEVRNPYSIPPEEYKDKSILIIDDICSYGGTFFHSAAALKDMGFGDIYLYVTHCENSILEGQAISNPELIKHIYTTSSIFTGKHERITVLED